MIDWQKKVSAYAPVGTPCTVNIGALAYAIWLVEATDITIDEKTGITFKFGSVTYNVRQNEQGDLIYGSKDYIRFVSLAVELLAGTTFPVNYITQVRLLGAVINADCIANGRTTPHLAHI